jgi:hypothetical protein
VTTIRREYAVPAGRRRAQKATATRPPARLALLVVGVVLAAAAWLFLVRAAIDFGTAARDDGGAAGWAMSVGAGLGATLCLLLVFVLLARLREQVAPARGQRPAGGHRR